MLYHKDVYLPDEIKFIPEIKIKNPIYSNHAKQQAKCDKFGKIYLPKFFIFSSQNIIEIEMINEKIEKNIN